MVVLAATPVPSRPAPAVDDWVTTMLCDPEVSPVPGPRSAKPSAAAPLLTRSWPVATAAEVEPTVPVETAAPALATWVTVKVADPGIAVELATAETDVLLDEVAVVLAHADCVRTE